MWIDELGDNTMTTKTYWIKWWHEECYFEISERPIDPYLKPKVIKQEQKTMTDKSRN